MEAFDHQLRAQIFFLKQTFNQLLLFVIPGGKYSSKMSLMLEKSYADAVNKQLMNLLLLVLTLRLPHTLFI